MGWSVHLSLPNRSHGISSVQLTEKITPSGEHGSSVVLGHASCHSVFGETVSAINTNVLVIKQQTS